MRPLSFDHRIAHTRPQSLSWPQPVPVAVRFVGLWSRARKPYSAMMGQLVSKAVSLLWAVTHRQAMCESCGESAAVLIVILDGEPFAVCEDCELP